MREPCPPSLAGLCLTLELEPCATCKVKQEQRQEQAKRALAAMRDGTWWQEWAVIRKEEE